MTHHRRVFAVCTTIVALAAVLVGSVPADATVRFQRYVALGDSYASGPLIPNQSFHPIGCARSDHNYAGDLARSLGISTLVDVTCGGASTDNMTRSQSVLFGSNPPQFNAVTANTDLVTITIGGNDIGFTSILETCAAESLTNPFGNPCQRHYTSGGTDRLAAAINATAPKITAVLAAIRQHAPMARIVVVGYLRILPPSGGCWPAVPIARGDVPYLDGVERELNAMIGQRATNAGVTFVNPGLTTGHDVCQSESKKWVEGILPTSLAFPVHPNGAGMTAVAGLVRTALR